ncbi:MAG: nuclear transport factor 2 family protein [Bryobacteraceae bacterium]
MPAKRPEDLHRLFVEAFNAADVDSLVALYESGAVLAAQSDAAVSGANAVRMGLEAFLALKGRIVIKTSRVIPAGDLALLHGKWSLTGTGPDGAPVAMEGQNAEVARRQADGTWRFVIDNPYSCS